MGLPRAHARQGLAPPLAAPSPAPACPSPPPPLCRVRRSGARRSGRRTSPLPSIARPDSVAAGCHGRARHVPDRFPRARHLVTRVSRRRRRVGSGRVLAVPCQSRVTCVKRCDQCKSGPWDCHSGHRRPLAAPGVGAGLPQQHPVAAAGRRLKVSSCMRHRWKWRNWAERHSSRTFVRLGQPGAEAYAAFADSRSAHPLARWLAGGSRCSGQWGATSPRRHDASLR